MRKVEFIMGMPITVDIPGVWAQSPIDAVAQDDIKPNVFDLVFARLREIDKRFSSYKENSELCKFQRGEISEKELSAEFKQIIKACQEAEEQTGGFFSAYFSGKFDPTGYVKGWAIDEAGKIIADQGYKIFCVGAGGDVLARSDSAKIWHIGIQDPRNKQKIIEVLKLQNGAVATSGSYERGAHIINPKTGKPADKFLSVSVIGPDIITADILATAIFAAGTTYLIAASSTYQAITISAQNEIKKSGNIINNL